MEVRSHQRHIGGFGCVPAGVLGRSFEFDELPKASLDNHALLLAFIQQLLLSLREGISISKVIFFEAILPLDILGARVDGEVLLAGVERGVEGGPGGHEELLLIRADIDDAVLVLHEVLHARGRVEGWGDAHGGAHETIE